MYAGGMMAEACTVQAPDLASQYRDLYWEAQYYRAQHARAVQREAVWKQEALALREVARRQQTQIKELNQQVEALKARVGWLQQQLFGRKSEQIKEPVVGSDQSRAEASDRCERGSEPRRGRGKQLGAKGHGRRRHEELPAEVVVHDLPPSQQRCPLCAKPLAVFPGT